MQNIVRPTEFVIGYAEFDIAFRAKKVLVRKWEREGAPIVRDDTKRPITERAEMWQWLKSRKKAVNPPC